MNFTNMGYEWISRRVRITSISYRLQEVERLLINLGTRCIWDSILKRMHDTVQLCVYATKSVQEKNFPEINCEIKDREDEKLNNEKLKINRRGKLSFIEFINSYFTLIR